MKTPPSTTDLRAALSKTLHSAAFGQLMRQCIAQAIEETAAKPQGIVLLPMEGCQFRFSSVGGGQALYIEAKNGDIRLCRDHTRPDGLTHWHPAHWRGHESRHATDGTEWNRVVPLMVMDDFGDLVEVAK